jgi:hypothetical protein
MECILVLEASTCCSIILKYVPFHQPWFLPVVFGQENREIWPTLWWSFYLLVYTTTILGTRLTWENTEMDLKYIGFEDVEWIHLAHNRVQWHTVMNPSFHTRWEISWFAELLLAYEVTVLWCMELITSPELCLCLFIFLVGINLHYF